MEVWIQKARRMLELRQGRPRAAALPRRVGPGACRTQGAGRGWPYPGGNLLYLPCKGSGQIRQEFGTELSLPGGSGTGLAAGLIDEAARDAVCRAWESRTRPPWGTGAGGEIYLHEGGASSDWTQGCIALEAADMARLFERWQEIDTVHILP